MCWNGTVWRPISSAPPTPAVKATIQAVAQARNNDQAERADAEAGHDRGGDHLRARIEWREEVKRKR